MKLLNNMAGSILLEFTTVLPFFMTLLFLGAEYAKLNDEIQKASYLTRELINIGVKTCGGLGSIDKIAECLGNDYGGQSPYALNSNFEQRVEAVLREQSPDVPVHLLIYSMGYFNSGDDTRPNDWNGLQYEAQMWRCIVPFGTCSNADNQRFKETLSASQIPAGWEVGASHTSRIRTTDGNLRSLIYNRCETYLDPVVEQTGNGTCAPGIGSGSCCGVVIAEGWIPYTPLTPVGTLIRQLVSLFGGSWTDARVVGTNGNGSGNYEIYFAVVL